MSCYYLYQTYLNWYNSILYYLFLSTDINCDIILISPKVIKWFKIYHINETNLQTGYHRILLLNQKKNSFERSTSCMCFDNFNICMFLTTCLLVRFSCLINIPFCWLHHFYEHFKIQIGRFNSLSCGLKFSASKHIRNTFLDVKSIFILCS